MGLNPIRVLWAFLILALMFGAVCLVLLVEAFRRGAKARQRMSEAWEREQRRHEEVS
jgi:hypothetical protein